MSLPFRAWLAAVNLGVGALLGASVVFAQVPVAAVPVAAVPVAAVPVAAVPLAGPVRSPAAFAAGSVEWRPEFRRVAWPEYVAAPLLLTGAFVQSFFFQPETDADWTGPILLDRPLQNALRASSARARSRANAWSNVLLASSALHLALIDPWLVAAWIHRRPDVAWQMTVIDGEIFGLTELSNRLTKRLVGRERPYGERCEADPDIGNCSTEVRYRSFFSGHATASSTFAGLTCAHHQKLGLYGSFAADLGACVASAGVTLTTGLLRIASDDHWWSDVVVGHLLGFSAGYLLTWALYYRDALPASESRRPLLVPIVGSGVWGLALGGQL
ncbi:MAG: phosphatase PAP2 family protein [Deltaproteobacteria bacterium]